MPITCQAVFIGYKFELTGGAVALDFANTIGDRKTRPLERLVAYRDLVDWAEQSELLPPAQARRLRASAAAPAEAVRRRAVILRELLFRIFSTVAAGRPLAGPDLARLDRWAARANAHRHLVTHKGAPRWVWDGGGHLDQMLWPVVLGAAELLTDEDRRRRLRVCQGWDCAWLFLDSSRRGDRRWCDMSVCGNRAKARRHHARSKRSA